MSYPQTRNASRAAWVRLRKTMSTGELEDIATDVVAFLNAEAPMLRLGEDIAATIGFALTAYPWEDKRQT